MQSQLEHLQLKTPGTGHPDTTKYEWLTNQRRDSYASYLGHHSMVHLFAVAGNQSVGRVRYELLSKMIQPCGPNPNKEADA